MMRKNLVWAALVSGCTGKDSTESGNTGDSQTAALQWYTTCGDPVCSGYGGPFPGIDLCTSEAEGQSCDSESAQCDPVSDCNALLVCATSDPKQQTGGCPISRAKHKREITYLDEQSRRAAADEALSLRLATWQYNWEDDGARRHLGFLIDDAPDSPAVRADGEVVDLYGYTSLALAAVQEQASALAQQRAELAQLRSELEQLRGACDARAK